MKPPRPRAPSLTDSLANMPAEAGTDAAVRRAFAQPEQPQLSTWEVYAGSGRETIQAHRMQLTDDGSLCFYTDNQVWLLIASGSWARVRRVVV